MAYDPRCRDLAKNFVDETWQGTQGARYEQRVAQLAQVIQDLVEAWLRAHPRPRAENN